MNSLDFLAAKGNESLPHLVAFAIVIPRRISLESCASLHAVAVYLRYPLT